MSDITWIKRDSRDSVWSRRWVALRNRTTLGRIYQDERGWFWFEDFMACNRLIELTGLTTIEEAQAAATVLLTLKPESKS